MYKKMSSKTKTKNGLDPKQYWWIKFKYKFSDQTKFGRTRVDVGKSTYVKTMECL